MSEAEDSVELAPETIPRDNAKKSSSSSRRNKDHSNKKQKTPKHVNGEARPEKGDKEKDSDSSPVIEEVVIPVEAREATPLDNEGATKITLQGSRLHMASLPPPEVPVFLQFKDINYTIKQKGADGKETERYLLKKISGKVKPGHFLAVMGPTGSGKTTFLSVLSRRVTRNVTGDILVNGEPPSKDYKRQVAFVLQDDVLFSNLTVEQTLRYTAQLRLGDLSREEQEERVNQVIDVLNLNKARHTLIGDGFARGVSGGERKRVNIGNEILTRPSLLLLDEPTSGLDTSTAINLMQALKGLADSGMTVVASIHQPSTQVFNLFDSLLLLVDGSPIYYGKAKKAVPYFAKLGLPCERYFNPADFMMGLILQEEIENKGGSSMKQRLIKSFNDHVGETRLEEIHDKKGKELFENCRKKQKEIGTPSYSTTFAEQVSILTRRSFFQTKGLALDILEFVQIILVAVVVGVLFFQSPQNERYISDRSGAIFFSVTFVSFFSPAFKALFEFPSERAVVSRERQSGAYRLSSYYLAKFFADFPFLILFPTIFWIIAYFLVGLKLTPGAFFFSYFVVCLNAFTSSSIAIFISCVTAPHFKKAIITLSVVLLSMMIAGGFYVKNFPFWLFWIQYLSALSPAFHPLLINDFSGTTWKRMDNSTSSLFASYNPIPGEVILDSMNLWFDNMGYYVLVSLGWGIVYRVAGFFALRGSLKPKN